MGGGRTAPNPSSTVWRWAPGQTSWSTGPNFTTARRNFAVDNQPGASGKIFLVGGYAPTAPTANMEIYSLGACATPTSTPTNTATVAANTSTPTRTATAVTSATPGTTSTPGTTATPGVTCTPIVFTDVLPTDYFYSAVQYLA